MDRVKILDRVRTRTEPWDIIVIGGGATGAGCALDAASRGLDVLLLEQHDFGKGTSSRSTKLIHGGVRYLAQGNLSLVREGLKERAILLKNAPHVVHKLAFVVPCYGIWQKIFYGTGLKIYDLLAGKYSFGKSRILSRSETTERLPSVRTDGLSGGVLYYDGQFDDARLLIDILITACEKGAAILNYARVERSDHSDKKVAGVKVFDAISGEFFEVRAKSIINATGPFCDAIRSMSDGHAKPLVAFSQGIHLVFDRRFMPSDSAIMIPKTRDGRVLFCIPWNGHTLVGTTDTPVESAMLEPEALQSEIDFVLTTIGEYLSEKPKREDILSVFAGIRPLVRSRRLRKTSALSRGHCLFVDPNGLITITGGKWTTYRRMAEDAVNKATEIGSLATRACITDTIEITAPASANETVRLHSDLSYTLDDVIRAVRVEMAQTVEDVLARRTRALFLNVNAAREIAPIVAEIIAKELGKNESQKSEQLVTFDIISRKYKEN